MIAWKHQMSFILKLLIIKDINKKLIQIVKMMMVMEAQGVHHKLKARIQGQDQVLHQQMTVLHLTRKSINKYPFVRQIKT